MGSFNGAERYELVGSYIQSKQEKILSTLNFGLYREYGLALWRIINGQQNNKVRENIIGVLKGIDSNLKEADFLDVSLNLRNGTYCPYKKPNDWFLYIHGLLNHPPNVMKQVPNSI